MTCARREGGQCLLLGDRNGCGSPPHQATCALHEIMSVRESGPAVGGLYAELFVSLLLRVSCMVGVQLPKHLQSKERKGLGRGQALRPLDPCR